MINVHNGNLILDDMVKKILNAAKIRSRVTWKFDFRCTKKDSRL